MSVHEAGAPTPRLSARLLGSMSVRLDGRPLSLDSGRAESLLAYLLLHRDAPTQRRHLAFLLWPDSTEAQAATNLRHVLHNLRRALPAAHELLDAGPRTLQWRPDAPVHLDVALFEQAVADGRLEEAVARYTGDLLEGSYDDWLLDDRHRLSQLHVDALDRLSCRLEHEGRRSEAIGFAERLVEADPLREEAYRRLIRLYDACGDRGRALRTYHVCAAALQRELGVEPSGATRRIYEALLPSAGSGGRPQAAAPPRRPPLVGRARERAQLSAAWRAASVAGPQLALVTGEPGIGKSRLVEELRVWCAQQGAVTAEARAYRTEGTMPYGIVLDWLRSEPILGRLGRLDDVHLTELARLLPELLVGSRHLVAPTPLGAGEQRQRLFRAATRALLEAGSPVLLVADDMQWCDLETLQVVHYLFRTESQARLLLAATARREDVDGGHPLVQFVTSMQDLGRVREIALGRLSREETGALAERLAGRSLSQGDVDRLYADSEGNPLFVVEAVRGGYGGGYGSVPAQPGLSPRVQAVISARLAQLSDSAAWLIGVAATIGRQFTTQVLADASGTDEQAFVRGLDELWRRGLVRAHGVTAYDFSHSKIREVAYAALSPALARHHHLRVAHALERSRPDEVDAVLGQVAAHHEHAGNLEEAARWYCRAAETALRLDAHADALRLLDRAVAVTHRLPAGTRRDLLELNALGAMPAPLITVEGYLSARVREVHRRALDLADTLGVELEPPLVRSLALATLSRGSFAAAVPYGELLRARAERDDDDVLWVESAYVLGVAAFWQGLLAEAHRQFAAALDRFRPGHRTAHLVRYGQDPEVFCTLRLGYTSWLLGRDEEAARALGEALRLARQAGQAFTRVSTTAWAGLLALDQHDDEMLRGHVQALRAEDSVELPRPTRMFVEALAGYVDVLDGRHRHGVEQIRRALDDARAGEPAAPGLLGMHMRILLEAYAHTAEHRAGLAATDEALAMGAGTQLWEAEVRRLRAEFLAASGAGSEQVDEELRRALHVATRQGARRLESRVRGTVHGLRAGTHRGTVAERQFRDPPTCIPETRSGA